MAATVAADGKKSPEPSLPKDAAVTTRYDNLEWIHLNETVLPEFHTEGLREKLVRKSKENPFVPIGAFATMVALTLGVVSMRNTNKQRSQMLMRFRIGAQGFTIAAILIGLGLGVSGTSPPP